MVCHAGEPYQYVCLIPAVAPSCSYCAVNGTAHWAPMSTPFDKHVWSLGEWYHQWHL